MIGVFCRSKCNCQAERSRFLLTLHKRVSLHCDSCSFKQPAFPGRTGRRMDFQVELQRMHENRGCHTNDNIMDKIPKLIKSGLAHHSSPGKLI